MCFLLDNSTILKNINLVLLSDYNVLNIFFNDLDAILSRVFYVNNNEPRSYFIIVQN